MFRGNALAKIDEKGRLKLPSQFRAIIGERFGQDLFVTSLEGDCVWIFPMATWNAVEERLARAPSTNSSIRKFRYRVNYFGQATAMDQQGRVLIQPLLRDQAETDGEVVVLGTNDHLEVWNRTRFEKNLFADEITPSDRDVYDRYGI